MILYLLSLEVCHVQFLGTSLTWGPVHCSHSNALHCMVRGHTWLSDSILANVARKLLMCERASAQAPRRVGMRFAKSHPGNARAPSHVMHAHAQACAIHAPALHVRVYLVSSVGNHPRRY